MKRDVEELFAAEANLRLAADGYVSSKSNTTRRELRAAAVAYVAAKDQFESEEQNTDSEGQP